MKKFESIEKLVEARANVLHERAISKGAPTSIELERGEAKYQLHFVDPDNRVALGFPQEAAWVIRGFGYCTDSVDAGYTTASTGA